MERIKYRKNYIKLKFSICARQYLSFLDYVIVCSKDDFMLIKDSNDTSIKLKKIHNIIEFYTEYDENLIRYIKGHLFLEYLINTILKKSLNKECVKYTFCEKIRLLYKKQSDWW